MENAKDTFFVMLRDRLAALNPARTIVVRGVTRPGIVVEENELPTEGVAADRFRLRWIGTSVDGRGALPLVALGCEIHYATDGSTGSAGMDRGRALAAMDAELVVALSEEPRSAAKINYAVTPAAAMGTRVFWGDVTFGNAKAVSERVERVATVEVYAYQEAGEL